MELGALSSPVVGRTIERGAVALWPIGSTEAHGPHLPLDTDVVIARESARRAVPAIRAALGLEALVLPALPFAITEFARPFPGTLGLSAEIAVRLLRELAGAIAEQGYRAVVLVNAHLEPEHRRALKEAVRGASGPGRCPIAVADPAERRFAARFGDEFVRGACHAGRYETSLVLAADAGRVDDAARRGLPALDVPILDRIKAGARTFLDAGMRDGYSGAPSEASIEEGERHYTAMSELIVEIVREVLA